MAGPRVYVNNLPWETKEEDLAAALGVAGSIVKTEVYRYRDGRSKGCGIVEFSSPEEAAAAIATFNDTELNGRKMQVREDREGPEGPAKGQRPPRAEGEERPARGGRGGARGGRGRGAAAGIERAPRPERAERAPRAPRTETAFAPGTSVYVGNLPWTMTWKDLKDIFAAYNPGYADVKVGSDGRSRGYGIVRFDTADAAAAAIAALNGTEVGEPARAIVVREDTGRPAPAQ